MQKKWICLEPKPFVSIHHLLIFKHNFKHLRDFSAMLLRISKFKLTNFAGRTSVMHNIVICKSLKNHFSVSQHWSEGERRVFEIKVSNWFLRKKNILWGLISIKLTYSTQKVLKLRVSFKLKNPHFLIYCKKLEINFTQEPISCSKKIFCSYSNYLWSVLFSDLNMNKNLLYAGK